MKFMNDYLFSWLTRDKEEMEEIRLAKMLEEEKAQFAVCFQFLFVWSNFVIVIIVVKFVHFHLIRQNQSVSFNQICLKASLGEVASFTLMLNACTNF